jgi:transposase
MLEDFFNSLLSFPSYWVVEKIEHNSITDEVFIYVKFNTKNYKEKHQESYYGIHDYNPYRTWRHLDILQYKTFIKARLPRIKDAKGGINTLEPPWGQLSDRHTYLFERRVIDTLLATRNQTKTSSLLQCCFSLVNRIIHQSTQRGLGRRDKNAIYGQLSIDEKSFKKGHNYVTVLSDPVTGHVIDVSEGRTKASCKELINNNLNAEQKENVEQVSMDMWEAYINTIKEILPKSKIVHDRFHLVQYLNKAVDLVRRREVKTYEKLKNSRYALLKNRFNLTMKQHFKFEDVLNLNTKVSLAWRLKESFKSLFNSPSYYEAHSRFVDWLSFCNWEKIPEISKVAKMFANHVVGVCNALVENLSNAMAERLNGKIQEIKTIGRGYRSFLNFRSAILFFNGGLNLYPQQIL